MRNGTPITPRDLAHLTIRASPRFTSKRGDLLGPRDPSGGATFEASASTLRLVRALRRPRVLRDVVGRPVGAEATESIVRLVLDDVLEVEHDGRFISGIDSWDLLCDVPARRRPRSIPTQLTLDALEYGSRLTPLPVPSLAYRLYRFNAIPCSPRWTARFPTTAAVAEKMGSDSLARHPQFREAGWSARPRANQSEPWISWSRRAAQRAHSADSVTFKLYVSPVPAAFRDAFQEGARVVLESEAFAFKVGGDLHGMLRPDKMVVYFATHAALTNAAAALRAKLKGMHAQGVPFSAPLGTDGLLSCGVDPQVPAGGDPLAVESWRLRAAGRLAGSLAVALRQTSGELTPAQFALARLALDGADLLDSNGGRAVRRIAESFGAAKR